MEFFPNARQENLPIGMLHAFMAMGVPDEVPADNVRSVVTGRDLDGGPVWQRDYAAFMGCVGFRTGLRRPRHPFTKGKVERLIRLARGNFLAGRDFTDITTLDGEALLWCAEQAGRWRRTFLSVLISSLALGCRLLQLHRHSLDRGNTHAMMLEDNSCRVADLVCDWIKAHVS